MFSTKQDYITPALDIFSIRGNQTLMASDFTLNNPEEGNTDWWQDDDTEG